MAALAFPINSIRTRRPAPTKESRRVGDRSHLRIVTEPTSVPEFNEQIFEDVERARAALTSEWSVWKQPMPVLPSHRIVTNFATHQPARVASSLLQSSLSPQFSRDKVAYLPAPESDVVVTRRSRVTTQQRFRIRRLTVGLLFSALLLGGLSGASALAGTHQGAAVVLAGTVAVPTGHAYIVQPGDTLWSIASRVYPHGDPRALVSTLSAQVGSAVVVPGEHLVLP